MSGDYARYIIEEQSSGDWAIVDTLDPCEENYYGLCAHGFDSEREARSYLTLMEAFPEQMCWNPNLRRRG